MRVLLALTMLVGCSASQSTAPAPLESAASVEAAPMFALRTARGTTMVFASIAGPVVRVIDSEGRVAVRDVPLDEACRGPNVTEELCRSTARVSLDARLTDDVRDSHEPR